MSNVIQTTNVYDVSKSRFISPLELRDLIYQVISENQELLRGPRGFNGIDGPAGTPGQDGVDVTNVVNGYITVVIYKLSEERPTTPTFTHIDVNEAGATVAVSGGWSNSVYTTVPDDIAQWASDGTFRYDNHTGQWSLLRWQLPYLLEGSVSKLVTQIGDVIVENEYEIIANALTELGYEITSENVRVWIEDEVYAQYGDSIAFVTNKLEAYASENLAYAADVETLSATVNGITAELDKQAYVVNGERSSPVDADSLGALSTLSDIWELDNTYLTYLGVIGRITNPEGTREFYQYLGPNNGWRQTSAAGGLTTFGSDKSLYTDANNNITGWSYLGGSGVDEEEVSEFTIRADKFSVTNSDAVDPITPFYIDASDPVNPFINLNGNIKVSGESLLCGTVTIGSISDAPIHFGDLPSAPAEDPSTFSSMCRDSFLVGDTYTNTTDGKIYTYTTSGWYQQSAIENKEITLYTVVDAVDGVFTPPSSPVQDTDYTYSYDTFNVIGATWVQDDVPSVEYNERLYSAKATLTVNHNLSEGTFSNWVVSISGSGRPELGTDYFTSDGKFVEFVYSLNSTTPDVTFEGTTLLGGPEPSYTSDWKDNPADVTNTPEKDQIYMSKATVKFVPTGRDPNAGNWVIEGDWSTPTKWNGIDGEIYYTWIKYADDSNGTGLSDSPAGKTYIGFAYNKTTPTESSTPSDYIWSKFVGEDGATGDQGVPGPAGADGQTTYTWIKYSNYSDGTNLYDVPNSNTLYIGIATNKLTAAESTNKTDYVWSKFKGDQGVQGPVGPTGTRGTVLQSASTSLSHNLSSATIDGLWSTSGLYPSKIAGDRILIASTATTNGGTRIYRYTGSYWTYATAFYVDGNAIIDGDAWINGTLSTNGINATWINAGTLDVDELTVTGNMSISNLPGLTTISSKSGSSSFASGSSGTVYLYFTVPAYSKAIFTGAAFLGAGAVDAANPGNVSVGITSGGSTYGSGGGSGPPNFGSYSIGGSYTNTNSYSVSVTMTVTGSASGVTSPSISANVSMIAVYEGSKSINITS